MTMARGTNFPPISLPSASGRRAWRLTFLGLISPPARTVFKDALFAVFKGPSAACQFAARDDQYEGAVLFPGQRHKVALPLLCNCSQPLKVADATFCEGKIGCPNTIYHWSCLRQHTPRWANTPPGSMRASMHGAVRVDRELCSDCWRQLHAGDYRVLGELDCWDGNGDPAHDSVADIILPRNARLAVREDLGTLWENEDEDETMSDGGAEDEEQWDPDPGLSSGSSHTLGWEGVE